MTNEPSIHDLFRKVREHPDFVFGTIFVKADFPGGEVPDDFDGSRATDFLVERGGEHIFNLVPYEECEECGAMIPERPGGSQRYHDRACSLYDPEVT